MPPITRRNFLKRAAQAAAGIALTKALIIRAAEHIAPKNPERKKYGTAKERIEAIPKIATQEMVLFKKKGIPGYMEEGAVQRNERMVEARAIQMDDRSVIHTHPIRGLVKFDFAMTFEEARQLTRTLMNEYSTPTVQDLNVFWKEVKTSNIEANHISTIDRAGKEIGRISIRASKKLKSAIKGKDKLGQARLEAYLEQAMAKDDQLESKLPRSFKDIIKALEERQKLAQELLKRFKQAGLQMHTTPMQGYELKEGTFRKKIAAR